MRLIKTTIFIGASLVLLAGGLGYYFYQTPLDPQAKKTKIEIEVSRGAGPREISKKLEDAALIKSAEVFLWLGRLTGSWSKVRAAEYLLSPALSPKEIFFILKSGQGLKRQILVREGANIFQIADELERLKITTREAAIELMRSRELLQHYGLWSLGIRSLEGYLQPNTYFYEKKDSAEFIVRRMADAFFKNWTSEFDVRAREIGLTRHEVITLASVIEKETGAGFERPLIASVFHNRLKKRMRLQSDPTTIYGVWEDYRGNITKKMLLTPSPYNTYTVSALPVGPISNPHIDAIRAALYPESSEFLFFVSKNDGTHVFTRTYKEHLEWVRRLQLDPSAREGKSWRDLKSSRE